MTSREIIVGSIAITLGAIVIAGGITAMPAAANSESFTPVEDLVPALESSQTSADRVHDDMRLADLGGIDPSTTRLLGEDAEAEYWVGRTDSSQICLLISIRNSPGTAASACGSVRDFYDHGIGLQMVQENSSREAYLIPADIPVRDIPFNPSAVSMPNAAGLIIVNSSSDKVVSIVIERDSGELFSFHSLRDERR